MELNLLELFQEFFWIFIPLALIQTSLVLIALWDWFKKREYLEKNKLVWLLVIFFLNIFGPIIYLWYSNNKIMPFTDNNDEWGN